MPEMDFSSFQDGLVGPTPIGVNLGVYAYMVFPEDEQLRGQWCKKFRLGVLAEKASQDGLGAASFPVPDLIELINRPPGKSVYEMAKQRHQQGLVAGHVLIQLLRMEQSSIKPTLNKARFLTSQFLQSRHLTASKSSIMKAWRLMHPVCHFWAAWFWESAQHPYPNNSVMFNDSEISPFIFAAESIAEMSLEHITASAKGSLISKSSLWRTPTRLGLPKHEVSIHFPPLGDDLVALLDSAYREYRKLEY